MEVDVTIHLHGTVDQFIQAVTSLPMRDFMATLVERVVEAVNKEREEHAAAMADMNAKLTAAQADAQALRDKLASGELVTVADGDAIVASIGTVVEAVPTPPQPIPVPTPEPEPAPPADGGGSGSSVNPTNPNA